MVCRPALGESYIRVGVMVAGVCAVFREVAIPAHKIVEDASADIHSIIIINQIIKSYPL